MKQEKPKDPETIDFEKFVIWGNNISKMNCRNCQYSTFSNSKKDRIITCGVHLQNFSSGSSCADWTKRKQMSSCCCSELVNFNKDYNQCFVCEKLNKKEAALDIMKTGVLNWSKKLKG